MLPFTHGISISDVNGISSSILLSTSAASYIIPPTATTTAKPAGQEEKSYSVGVIAESSSSNAAIAWFSSQLLLDESVNSAIGGGNLKYVAAISKYMSGAEEASTEAAPLPLITEKLTFALGSRAIVALLVVGIVPISTLIIGRAYCYKRKRK